MEDQTEADRVALEQGERERRERVEKDRARRQGKTSRNRDVEEWAKGKVADCAMSLAQAMQDAGGAVGLNILNMTMREFIVRIAGQNDIRFVYVDPDKEADDD